MVDIATSINIKKQKLAYEYSKENPNKIIISRLKESIRRHERDMIRRKRAIRLRKRRQKEVRR